MVNNDFNHIKTSSQHSTFAEFKSVIKSAKEEWERIISNAAIIVRSAFKKTNEIGCGGIPKEIKPTSSTLKAEIKRIKETPNWRLNGRLLAKVWLAKYHDPEIIHQALGELLRKDSRFNESEEGYKLDNEELLNVYQVLSEELNHPRNGTDKKIQKIQTSGKAERSKTIKKIQKQIRLDLVGLLKRPASQVSFKDKDNNEVTYTQRQGHLEFNSDGAYEFIEGNTLSADLQKSEVDVREAANLGIITSQDQVILARSSRTDDPEKIAQKSAMDIIARLEKGQLQKGEEGDYYIYERVDVTFMDDNFLKATATQLKTGFKSVLGKLKGKETPIENERAFLHNKRAAIQQMWYSKKMKIDESNGKRYLERKVVYTSKEGKRETAMIREYEPIVVNHVFSGQAKEAKGLKRIFGNNVKKAREDNIDSYLTLVQSIIIKENLPVKEGLKQSILEYQNHSSQKRLKTLFEKLQTDFNLILQDSSNPPSDRMRIGLEAALMLISGKDKHGNGIDNERGSGIQFLATVLLTDLAGVALSVECKSGNDRTAIGMALTMALEEFKETHSRPFDLQNVSEKEITEFKELFTNYIVKFGRPNVLSSRGKRGEDYDQPPLLKTQRSPVFRAFTSIPADDENTWNKRGLTLD